MKVVFCVYIMLYMYWDCEWYFIIEELCIFLVNNMEEILICLEQDEVYKYYVFDGQMVVLEDYFVVKFENCLWVKVFVECGKLIIGLWYIQIDIMIVSGELIVCNLMYGICDCMVFGELMMIGYLLDLFGMLGQFLYIYNGFGIICMMFWCGCFE